MSRPQDDRRIRTASVALLAAVGMTLAPQAASAAPSLALLPGNGPDYSYASFAAGWADLHVLPADQPGWSPTRLIALDSTHSVTINVATGHLTVSVDDPAGNKRTYRRDAGGRRTEYRRGSAVTTYDYDSADRLTRVELPDGTVGTIIYDVGGRARAVESSLDGQTIDAFTVTYGPADAPCLPDDIGKSTVTNPGDRTTVSYCITIDGRGIDRAADVDGLDVEPSGTLIDHVGDYLREGVVEAKISATDEGTAGVASIKLVDGHGHPIGSPANAPGCPAACPERFAATFVVDVANLGDGAHDIIAVATDAAGNSSEAVVSLFYVDTVGPGPVTGIREDEYRSDTEKSIVRWMTPNDPDLPGGSLGSGSAASKARYKVGSGPFTSWRPAEDEQLAVPAADGENVTMEIRARDARGNESSTASITYAAGVSE